MHHIGAKLSHVSKGRVHITAAYEDHLTQQHGLFHGGVIATLADNAMGYAAYSTMEADQHPLSQEFKINLVGKGMGEKLVAKAEVVKAGKTIKVVRCDVYGVKDGVETLCATSLGSIFTLEGNDEGLK